VGLGIAIAVDGTPDDLLAGAAQVEVEERMGDTARFRLRFGLDIGDGDLPLLLDNRIGPGSELSVLVPSNGTTHCLVKGPVHGQRIHLVHGGTGSTVEVWGSDGTVTMDREARSVVHADGTDSDAVTSVLGGYGFVADVDPTPGRHLETKHALVQRESDLRFVRKLARRNGYLFWLTSDDHGVDTAHFKRPDLSGDPARTVRINLAAPNVDSLDLVWDVERPTSVEGAQLDANTKERLDGAVAGSPLEAMAGGDLASITGDTRSVFLAAPADDAGDLQARGEGALIEAGWFVRVRCATTLEGLGDVARAHTVAMVRGAGSRHSGRYFVAGVRHRIDPAGHRMDLDLVRNAWET
jgi:phage protein D